MSSVDGRAAIARVLESNSDRFTDLVDAAGLVRARDFQRANLRRVNLRNEILSGFDFNAAHFEGADLTGADVRGVNFGEAKGLAQANLTGVLEDASTRWPANTHRPGTLLYIPPGRFLMGTPEAEGGREYDKLSDTDDERPVHEVTIPRGFFLGRTPVTVGEFRRFVAETNRKMPKGAWTWTEGKGWGQNDEVDWANPGFPQDDRHPVTCVSHEDATAYVDWLSEETRREYRLPTEVEWEYACRAGTRTARFWGDGREGAVEYANGADRSLALATKEDPAQENRFFSHDDGFAFTSPVGAFKANPFGLFDMLGNVLEWCRDWYTPNYVNSPNNGTENATPDNPDSRVLRGGSRDGVPRGLRSGTRNRNDPRYRYNYIGFRVARALAPLES